MKTSAGILLYRKTADAIEYLLVHPGGPYFLKKHEGSWSIPKGELMDEEEPLAAAIREFEEETGQQLSGDFMELQPVVQKGGKRVLCWAVEGDLDCTQVKSNDFELEWPPKSDNMQHFPEIDKACWFDLNEARRVINEKQIPLLEELWLRKMS